MKTPNDCLGPLNLGTTIEYTILEIAEKIIQLTDSKSKIIFKNLPENDPIRRCPDTTLAKKSIGWEPKTSIEEGLKKTIAYFKDLVL
jgi:UDP-glucuronate decarboxylase